MKVLALGADDPAPDENTVISSEPVSILFVLRNIYIFTSYFHAGLWIWIQIRMDPDPLHFNTTRPTPRAVSWRRPAGQRSGGKSVWPGWLPLHFCYSSPHTYLAASVS